MRSISSTLLAAQKATSHTPYIHIRIGGTDYSSRLKFIEHHEEAYMERALIILRNDDRALDDVDLLGEYLEVGYGFETSLGNEYSNAPGLWVKSQQTVSMEGQLLCELECRGMWNLLREMKVLILGEAPYYDASYDRTKTIYELIELVLGAVDFELDDLGDQDDGIINDFKPVLAINGIPFENCATVLYRLIYMTKCYLRAKADKRFEIRFPQEDDDIDERVYSYKAHFFNEFNESRNLTIPNKILIFCNSEGGNWENLITGEDEDSESIEDYGYEIAYCQIAADITNQTDADNRAAAVMTKLMAEKRSGTIILPHDCRIELYDRMKIYDRRS